MIRVKRIRRKVKEKTRKKSIIEKKKKTMMNKMKKKFGTIIPKEMEKS